MPKSDQKLGKPQILSLFPDLLNKFNNTVKPVQNGQSKIDKTKILMTNGSLMKIKSITFDLH